MLKAVIFDLDGTILDTETPEFVSWQEAYAAHGVSLAQAVWSQAIGTADSGWDPYVHLETLLGGPIDRATLGATRHARFDVLMGAAEPRAGVVAWLDEARPRLAGRPGLQLGCRLGDELPRRARTA